MEPQEILNRTRKAIRDHAGNNPDKWFYANRFVFARLQLDERKTKTQIKRDLLQAQKLCPHCNKPFESGAGVHLHRRDGSRGYSLDNCTLMHPGCHIEHHKDSLCEAGIGDLGEVASPVLEKTSRRYDGKLFLYWWDINPVFLNKMDLYEAVEFVRNDTGERCHVPTPALKGFLTKERQTGRGKGNWGIKVLRERDGELAFEPGTKKNQWLFLPVVWLSEAYED